MVTIPPEMPNTSPATGSIVAMVLSLLLHVPPEVGSARADIVPTHSLVMPVIADVAGRAFTVSAIETDEEQPKPFVME